MQGLTQVDALGVSITNLSECLVHNVCRYLFLLNLPLENIEIFMFDLLICSEINRMTINFATDITTKLYSFMYRHHLLSQMLFYSKDMISCSNSSFSTEYLLLEIS